MKGSSTEFVSVDLIERSDDKLGKKRHPYQCNVSLGLVKDDVEILLSMVAYPNKWKER